MNLFNQVFKKLSLSLLMTVLFSSCALTSISNTPSTLKTDSNIGNYYVTDVNIELDAKLKNNDNLEKLKEYKKVFKERLSERNVVRSNEVKVKVFISKLQIKGAFARMNRMLGGKDIVETSVEVSNKKGRVIKKYNSHIQSGIILEEKQVYRLSSSAILHEIFGNEKE